MIPYGGYPYMNPMMSPPLFTPGSGSIPYASYPVQPAGDHFQAQPTSYGGEHESGSKLSMLDPDNKWFWLITLPVSSFIAWASVLNLIELSRSLRR